MNNKRTDSPLGLGLVDNSRKIVDAINQTHDQFVWEVRMGQRKVAVPAEMLRPPVQFGSDKEKISRPPMFDKDANVFVQMYGDPDGMKITDLTTPIRNDQYEASMDFFLSEFENAIGLSQGTFTSTPSGIQTATEVVSNNSMTYQTRSSYLTQVEKQLNNLVIAVLELAECGGLFSDGVVGCLVMATHALLVIPNSKTLTLTLLMASLPTKLRNSIKTARQFLWGLCLRSDS